MIPILILAGGASRRMGDRDKLLETVDGMPLLRTLAMRALATEADVFVALPKDAAARLAVLDGLSVTPLIVPEAVEGMSGTMRGAIAQIPTCPAFMLLLADLPEITTADMIAVIAARDANPDHLVWRGATDDGAQGHPIIFDSSLRPAFAGISGDGGGEVIVKPLRDKTHLTRLAGQRARLDLDTPEDWAAWRFKTSE